MTYRSPVCRGSYVLGTACGRCERCAEERAKIDTSEEDPAWYVEWRGDLSTRHMIVFGRRGDGAPVLGGTKEVWASRQPKIVRLSMAQKQLSLQALIEMFRG